jgi:thiamine pyrophosphokinase
MKCIIFGNGSPPQKAQLEYLMNSGYSTLICADGGAEKIREYGMIPDVIIGDFDSVTADTLEFFRDKVKIMQYRRQNDTDIEKSIKYAASKGFTEAVLTAVTGDRLDHSFCNLGVVLKFRGMLKLSILSFRSVLTVITGVSEFATEPGETISVYGLDSSTVFSSRGLKYRLNKVTLPFGLRESTSNVATGKKVKLIVEGGAAFLVRDFNTMRRNGFI